MPTLDEAKERLGAEVEKRAEVLLDVSHRIHAAHDVLDVVVLEAPDDVEDGVHLPDVGEKLIPQALALAGALYQAGNVHELHRCRDGPLRGDDPRQRVEPGIGYLHDPGIGLDRGEGIVRHQCLGRGERIEEGGLPDIGETDDAQPKHGS